MGLPTPHLVNLGKFMIGTGLVISLAGGIWWNSWVNKERRRTYDYWEQYEKAKIQANAHIQGNQPKIINKEL
eukprot:CAMPEP_0177656334 /NCGR_PEP_ID=MMETSP0447-20121125/15503_1 /TAXON_ID=0 /ORGANISM="Stygamoeba regulata, Strain BSH-02190019" /LENGTH=71 /DNA_ID=CAMNT_0019160429 /DNA_START=86 /DNA_END=301 /DNA_ORIENTATION=+